MSAQPQTAPWNIARKEPAMEGGSRLEPTTVRFVVYVGLASTITVLGWGGVSPSR